MSFHIKTVFLEAVVWLAYVNDINKIIMTKHSPLWKQRFIERLLSKGRAARLDTSSHGRKLGRLPIFTGSYFGRCRRGAIMIEMTLLMMK